MSVVWSGELHSRSAPFFPALRAPDAPRRRRLLALVAILGGMAGCAPSVTAGPPALFAGVAGPLVIAHRGGALEAPENTLAALAHGLACGADWEELDVRLTNDGRVVVLHDDTLDRTTTGHGRIEDASLAAVRLLSAGSPRLEAAVAEALGRLGLTPPDFGGRYATEGVPTLEEALALPEARFVVELKSTRRPVLLVEQVLAAVHRAGAEDRVALAAMQPELLDLVYARDPSVPLVGIVAAERMLEPMLARPVSVLSVRLDLLEATRAVSPPQVAIWAWTAYSAAMAEEAIERGAHGVITDAPAAVLAALRTPPPVTIPLSR